MTAAERLVFLEQKDKELSTLLHNLTRLRQQVQEEARKLRTSLTATDRHEYDARVAGLDVATGSQPASRFLHIARNN